MEALVDFSKTEWQESIYSLNKYLLKKKKKKKKQAFTEPLQFISPWDTVSQSLAHSEGSINVSGDKEEAGPSATRKASNSLIWTWPLTPEVSQKKKKFGMKNVIVE